MKYAFVYGIVLFFALVITLTSGTAQAAPDSCTDQELPRIEWLGNGSGTYLLPDWAEVFLVKKHPFNLQYFGGSQYTPNDSRDRVWACAGDCTLFNAYHDTIEFGEMYPNDELEVVVIDDDDDDRINWWSVNTPEEAYQRIEDQQLAQHLTFTVPFTGTWFFQVNDSIFMTHACRRAQTTPEPTSTSTNIPPVTATKEVSPTLTPVIEETPVPEESPEPSPTVVTPIATFAPSPTPNDLDFTWLPIIRKDCDPVSHQYGCGN